MRISSVQIKNLRAFDDETVHMDRYTCLVGPNGAGKSTVLCALNIFFRETEGAATNLARLEPEDFHQRRTAEPIEITVTFTALSSAEQDAFADYYRQGQLVVTAEARFDEASNQAVVKQSGKRLVMKEFAQYFQRFGDKARAEELRGIYSSLREQFPDLDRASTLADMAAALRAYETARPDQCVLMSSDDEFYGVQGAGKLRRFVQWVYVPAVKDASNEQAEAKNTALGRLLARTVRAKVNFEQPLQQLRAEAEAAYRTMLDTQQAALNEVSETLQQRLAEWSHPDATARLAWQQDLKRAVQIDPPFAQLFAGDGEFEGQIARFGHGLQRSYIIALLHGLAAFDLQDAPRLILGIEEPELYQHPPQARHLAQVLDELSKGNSQVIATTHSPVFVGGEGFESIRMVRKDRTARRSHVRRLTFDDLAGEAARHTGQPPVQKDAIMVKLHQVLQPAMNEMFFTHHLVLCEGLEDVAYINAWMHLTGRQTAMRRRGSHVVAAGKKSEILRPLLVARAFGLPTFVLFDADGDKIAHENPATAQSRRAQHSIDNCALISALGAHVASEFPSAVEWGADYAIWPNNLEDCISQDCGQELWDYCGQQATNRLGGAGGLKKFSLHIGERLRLAQAKGATLGTLDDLCGRIVKHSEST